MQHNNIELHSCTERIEDYDENPTAFLSEGVRALFNQQYVHDVRAKSIAGKTAKVKQWAFPGGTPPLGYDIVGGAYVVNPHEAEAVKMIFSLYAIGHGYDFIMTKLSEDGYLSKKGAPIGNNAIYYILKREAYIGIYSWNRRKVKYLGKWVGVKPNPNIVKLEGIIPAIIDIETWEIVRSHMENNRHKAPTGTRREYLLSGLLECAACGGAFCGVTKISQKKIETPYYICSAKHRNKTCNAHNINANQLDGMVVKLVKESILSCELIEKTADFIMKMIESGQTDDSDAIKHELIESERKIVNIMSFVENGTGTPDLWQRLTQLEEKKCSTLYR